MKKIAFIALVVLGFLLFVNSPGAEGSLSCTFETGNSTCGTGFTVLNVLNETGGTSNAHASFPWWNASFTYRNQITFNTSNITQDLINFPVLVVLNSSTVDYTQTQDNGSDLRFIDPEGTTPLQHEIELWNESGNSYIWVTIPNLSKNVTTDFVMMYYGNSTAASGQNRSGVWDANYVGVWHLNGDPGGAEPVANDSTRYGNNASGGGAMSSTEKIVGTVDGAFTFVPNHYLDAGNASVLQLNGSFTLTTWFRHANWTASDAALIAKETDVSGYQLDTTSDTGNRTIRVEFQDGNGQYVIRYGTTNLSTGTWYHATAVYNASGNTLYVYLNGVIDNGSSSGTLGNNGINDSRSSLMLAWRENTGTHFNGSLDEARVSNIARSAEWIKAEYRTSSNLMNTIGSAETSYANAVCCRETDSAVNLSLACGTTVARLSSTTNSHTAQGNETTYTVPICLQASSASSTTVACTYTEGACAAGTTCLFSMANADGVGYNGTNAHIAQCNVYTRNVCCATNINSVCVNETGVCWPTIQEAITNATAGQTVIITDNRTYSENVTIGKRLTITSNGTSYPTITSSVNTVSFTSGANLTISRLNVTTTATGITGAVYLATGNLIMSDAIVTVTNGGSTTNGVYVWPAGNMTLTRVNVSCVSCQYAVFGEFSPRSLINNSRIAGSGFIHVYISSSNTTIQNSVINITGGWAFIDDDPAGAGYLNASNSTFQSDSFEAVKAGPGRTTITDSVLLGVAQSGLYSMGSFTLRNVTLTGAATCVAADGARNHSSFIIDSTCTISSGLAITAGTANTQQNFTIINSTTFTPGGTSFTTCTGNRLCNVTFQNYLDAYITDSGGSGIVANVTATNNFSAVVVNTTTSTAGYITRQNVTYVWRNSTRTWYSQNHVVNATRTNYYANASTVNMSVNRNVTLTLSTDPCWTSSGDLNVSTTLTCTNTQLTVNTLQVSGTLTIIGGNLTTNRTTITTTGTLYARNSTGSVWHNGNLTIAGNYSLDNATLHMNVSTIDGAIGIQVNSTGRMFVTNLSNVTTGNNGSLNYFFVVNGTLNTTNSILEQAGWTATTDSRGITINGYGQFVNTTTIAGSDSTGSGIEVKSGGWISYSGGSIQGPTSSGSGLYFGGATAYPMTVTDVNISGAQSLQVSSSSLSGLNVTRSRFTGEVQYGGNMEFADNNITTGSSGFGFTNSIPSGSPSIRNTRITVGSGHVGVYLPDASTASGVTITNTTITGPGMGVYVPTIYGQTISNIVLNNLAITTPANYSSIQISGRTAGFSVLNATITSGSNTSSGIAVASYGNVSFTNGTIMMSGSASALNVTNARNASFSSLSATSGTGRGLTVLNASNVSLSNTGIVVSGSQPGILVVNASAVLVNTVQVGYAAQNALAVRFDGVTDSNVSSLTINISGSGSTAMVLNNTARWNVSGLFTNITKPQTYGLYINQANDTRVTSSTFWSNDSQDLFIDATDILRFIMDTITVNQSASTSSSGEYFLNDNGIQDSVFNRMTVSVYQDAYVIAQPGYANNITFANSTLSAGRFGFVWDTVSNITISNITASTSNVALYPNGVTGLSISQSTISSASYVLRVDGSYMRDARIEGSIISGEISVAGVPSNLTIANSTYTGAARLGDGGNGAYQSNLTFVNTTGAYTLDFTNCDGTPSCLYTHAWYILYNVTSSGGSPLTGSTVTATNRSGGTVISSTTAATGFSGLHQLTQWYRLDTVNTSTQNTTFLAALSGYTGSNATYNVTGNMIVNLTLAAANVCIRETGVCWTNISDAVNNATASQTVVITDNATYTEAVLINKAITLTSNGSSLPLLNFSNSSTQRTTLNVTANNVNISRLLFNNTAGLANGAYISATGKNLHLHNMTLEWTTSNSSTRLINLQEAADNFQLYNVTSISDGGESIALYTLADSGVINASVFRRTSAGATTVFDFAKGNKIRNTTFEQYTGGSAIDINADPGTTDDVGNDADTSNSVNGKPLLWINGVSGYGLNNASSYGEVIVTNSSNVRIENDTFDGALAFGGVTSFVVNNMTLRNNLSYGITGHALNTFTISNTTILFPTSTAVSGFGIYPRTAGSTTGTLRNVTFIGDRGSQLLYKDTGFNRLTIVNTSFTVANGLQGIVTAVSSTDLANLVENVTCTSTNSTAACIEWNSDNSQLVRLTFNLTQANALMLTSGWSNSSINDTLIQGTSNGTGTQDGTIYINNDGSSSSLYFYNLTLNITAGTQGIRAERSRIHIYNSSLTTTGGVFAFDPTASQFVLFNLTNVVWSNTSYSFAGCGGSAQTCNITANWYINTSVNESVNSQPLAGAVVQINRSNAVSEGSATTGGLGQTLQTAAEYTRNGTVVTYFTNHTVTATTARYAANNTIVNLTSGNHVLALLLYPNLATQGTPTLNASDNPTNSSAADLTCWNQSTTDIDGDTVTNVYAWSVDSTRYGYVHYAFDTNLSRTSLNAVRDYAGDDNNGTLGNATQSSVPVWNASGRVGGAYTFDGADDFIGASPLASLSAATVALWVRPDVKSATASYTLLSEGSALRLDINTAGYALAIVNASPFVNYVGLNLSNATNANTWYHLAFTVNTNTQTMSLYINGSLVNSTSISTGVPLNGTTFCIGIYCRDTGAPINAYAGSIDDVRVYNRTLSAAQIYQLYTEGLSGASTSTIAGNETTRGEIWSCSVVANDNTGDSAVASSTSMTIRNAVPSHTTPLANASDYPSNRTTANLTCYNQTSFDADADAFTNIYTWTVNGESYETVHLAFDTNISLNTTSGVRDYAGNDTNGTLGDGNASRVPSWNASGKSGGAYTFDGVDDFISLGDIDALDGVAALTVSAWARTASSGSITGEKHLVDKSTCNGDSGADTFELQVNAHNAYFFVGNASGSPASFNSGSSSTLVDDAQWHMITGVYSSSGIAIYIDGLLENSTTITGITLPATTSYVQIGGDCNGIGMVSDYLWNGSIDDVRLYNRSLSAEQIYQLYLETNNSVGTSTIHANETGLAENWVCSVTPNDHYGDGITRVSNTVTIGGTLPNTPVLDLPADANTSVFERYTYFNWSGSDNDSDAITYTWNISSPNGCAAIPEHQTLNTYYTSVDKLCIDRTYNWTVKACDVDGCSPFAAQRNFTIASVVGLTFVDTSVQFGTLGTSTPSVPVLANTSTSSPAPLRYNNTGNVDTNVSTKANAALWSQQPLDTQYFQYGDENATSWSNFSSSYATLYTNLSYGSVPRELEIQVEVPVNEPLGVKNTTVTVLGVSLE